MRGIKGACSLLLGFIVLGALMKPSSAQGQMDEVFRAAAPPPPVADYNTVINQFSLDDLRLALNQSSQHGLNPKMYWTDRMEQDWQRGGGDVLKREASTKYLNYLRDLYTGVMNPETMPNDVKLPKKVFITPQQLQAVVVANGTQASLVADGLAPQTPQYLALKAALNKVSYACTSGTWETLPGASKTLKLGVRNKVVPQLKARLELLGYPILLRDDLVDETMIRAINDIQYNLRMKPDGVMSPRGPTWEFFRVSCAQRVAQLQADMEKMRWLPQRFEDRHIFVNLMMSYFYLQDPSQKITMNFKVINGRQKRKTPTMIDRMSKVILNPFWVVPPTIFIEDKVEEIKKLAPSQVNAYFAQRNYEVWNSNFTKRLDPSTINWWAFDPDNDPKIYIRQKPHMGNALGVVKFLLNNSFSIYLHDTNQRELFAEANRQLSSGCVRVERPMDLAEYMLRGTEWTREKIESTVAKPGEVLEKDTPITLKNSMAVYLVPLTSTYTSDGVIRFAQDTYGHNKLINRALPPL